ncbi:MAG: hypothetical protein K0R99_478 [Microbacterium sp.]|jgi:hypothetical protein|uniref:hypothetical protein n=1 Tax=Microbacterium sp. TaxID=51671 RepID=UPI00260E4831|nr:hypothetical protein [Microbacterium sp.]MDF2559032.1 hypothetical protein [Microbacterium sp.]
MHTRTTTRSGAGLVALFLAGSMALSGCSTPGTGAEAAPTQAPAVGATADGLRVLLRDISFDYNDVQSNDELADLSDAVFSGTIVGVSDGPQFGKAGDGLEEMRSVVVEVRATEVVKGSVKAGKSAHVVIYAPVDVNAARWSAALPSGTKVIVYATVSAESPRGTNGLDTINPAKGRPKGATLYVPAVQGFVVELSDGTLYWPLTEVARDDELAEAMPGGDALGNLLPGEE